MENLLPFKYSNQKKKDDLNIEGVRDWDVIKHDSLKNYKDKIKILKK